MLNSYFCPNDFCLLLCDAGSEVRFEAQERVADLVRNRMAGSGPWSHTGGCFLQFLPSSVSRCCRTHLPAAGHVVLSRDVAK